MRRFCFQEYSKINEFFSHVRPVSQSGYLRILKFPITATINVSGSWDQRLNVLCEAQNKRLFIVSHSMLNKAHCTHIIQKSHKCWLMGSNPRSSALFFTYLLFTFKPYKCDTSNTY